jgi:hypothetical protein
MTPVSGPTALMRDRRDEDVIRLQAIHDRVWESVKNKSGARHSVLAAIALVFP